VWICLGEKCPEGPVIGREEENAWKPVDMSVPASVFRGANGMARECHLHLLFSRVFICLP